MTHIKLIPLLLAVAGGTALAQNAGSLQACRGIADTTARLACYDALPLPSPAAAAPAKQAAPAAPDPAGFGFETKAVQAANAALPSVDSTIPGRFSGWNPRDRITLANGQVWQVVDDSTAVVSLKDAKVTVRRGAMGAFYLELEGSNRSARVRRIE